MTGGGEAASIVDRVRELARGRRSRIVFADVHDERVQGAVQRIEETGIATPVCVEDPSAHPQFEDIAYRYYEALREEGVTEVGAVALAGKPAWFAAGLVAGGGADAVVCGPATTAHQLVLASARALGPRDGVDGLGSSTLLLRGSKTATLADAHVGEAPDAERLAESAKAACDLHRRLTGDATSVAFLATDETTVAEAALKHFLRRWPGLEAGVAAADALLHDCDREPNVLIVPGRAAGAAALGLLARLGGFRVIGPILHGVQAPCVGIPPCASVDDVLTAAAVAAACTLP